MKKWVIFILIGLMLLSIMVLSGCSKATEGVEVEDASELSATVEESQVIENTTATEISPTEPIGPPMDPESFKGYWWKVEEDDNGEVKDLRDNPVYWLEINENRLYFYTTSLNEDEGYGVSDKYYVLDGAYCYFDYDEITQDNYKQAIDAVYGGRFIVGFDDEDRLVITDYYNFENKDDGYNISYYVKVPATEWPIEE